MPPSYWAEGLATATYLLNRRPSSSVNNSIPFQLLHRKIPDYSMLHVFGCLCYPNLSATAAHKLAPRSAVCVFLGYPSSHKGYRCLNISTRRIIILRHVIFDETVSIFGRSCRCFLFGLSTAGCYCSFCGRSTTGWC
ncbi:Os05g0380700 [Oryza sativa Japonica Group]|uniref:Os05g0380700 protein n=2 Tax=Oryza sativa subsp. japonica TaxID=39947 RepID=C7J2J6_ORYSJ|nr:Os05g0380700 [Oryza sativa Japonica Group]|eukprot:NP_001174398.1 Os05g0380700 [Oryza sativa Japonica Group]